MLLNGSGSSPANNTVTVPVFLTQVAILKPVFVCFKFCVGLLLIAPFPLAQVVDRSAAVPVSNLLSFLREERALQHHLVIDTHHADVIAHLSGSYHFVVFIFIFIFLYVTHHDLVIFLFLKILVCMQMFRPTHARSQNEYR